MSSSEIIDDSEIECLRDLMHDHMFLGPEK